MTNNCFRIVIPFIGAYLIFFSSLHICAQVPKHRIIWSDSVQLNWIDFKGVCDASNSNGFSAVSSVGFYRVLKVKKSTVYVNTIAFFDKNKSWECGIYKTEYSLKHEQSHFNIAEIYARLFRKKLNNSKYGHTYSKISSEVNRIYNSTMRKYSKYQNDYDRNTEHSVNIEEQELWNEKISIELEKLRIYSSPIVEIKIQK